MYITGKILVKEYESLDCQSIEFVLYAGYDSQVWKNLFPDQGQNEKPIPKRFLIERLSVNKERLKSWGKVCVF
jgi:hypothetical protein